MSYGTVVKELARSLEGHIIAYDNLPNHGGCILYIDGPVRRIDIEIGALDQVWPRSHRSCATCWHLLATRLRALVWGCAKEVLPSSEGC